jgi:hypothetical protein
MENQYYPIDSIEEFKTSATTANTSPCSEGTRKNMFQLILWIGLDIRWKI